MNPRPFADTESFASYWKEMLRYQPLPYCFARIKGVTERPIAQDLMLVDFELTFIMNTQLWFLLIFLALPLAAIVDLMTRKTVKVQMRKLLYRAGDEWHMFNGEYQGPEELDTRWLHNQPPTIRSPRSV
jgi:hypothetical protein